jgi:hypothetical protein
MTTRHGRPDVASPRAAGRRARDPPHRDPRHTEEIELRGRPGALVGMTVTSLSVGAAEAIEAEFPACPRGRGLDRVVPTPTPFSSIEATLRPLTSPERESA